VVAAIAAVVGAAVVVAAAATRLFLSETWRLISSFLQRSRLGYVSTKSCDYYSSSVDLIGFDTFGFVKSWVAPGARPARRSCTSE
jgi:hypothetical protein